MAAEVRSVRRYYLLKRLFARRTEEPTEQAWQAKQEAEPGIALGSEFPHLTALAGCGYTTQEDIDGADVQELVDNVNLSRHEAETVLNALANL